MSGDARNAALWQNADVYLAPVDTAGPTDVTTPWASDWKAAGLLDGAEGFTMARDQETQEHFAWGGILVKKTSSQHKRTVRFVALEDNAVVFDLVNPGSTRTTDAPSGLTTSVVKTPQGKEFAIGFEMRDGDKIKRRSVLRAEVEEVAEIKESEEALTVFDVTVVLYPEADGTLYTEIEGSTAEA